MNSNIGFLNEILNRRLKLSQPVDRSGINTTEKSTLDAVKIEDVKKVIDTLEVEIALCIAELEDLSINLIILRDQYLFLIQSQSNYM